LKMSDNLLNTAKVTAEMKLASEKAEARKLAEDTAKAARLAARQAAESDGTAPVAEVTEEDREIEARRAEILADLIPTAATQLEADAKAVSVARMLAGRQVEVASGRVSLGLALVDVMFYRLKSGEIKADKMAAVALKRYARTIPGMTDLEATAHVYSLNGEDVTSQHRVAGTSIFDLVDREWTNACEIAAIIASGKTTGAVRGYLSGEKLGGMAFTATWSAEAPEQPYLVGCCMAFNKLQPSIPEVVQGKVVMLPNEDDTLRWMTVKMVRACFLQHYDKQEPAIDPKTGFITPKVTTRAPASGTGAKGADATIAAAKSDIDKLLLSIGITMRDKRMTSWGVPSPKDTSACLAGAFLGMLQGMHNRGEFDPSFAKHWPCAATLGLILTELSGIVSAQDTKTGNHKLICIEGNKSGVLIESEPFTLPEAEAEAAAVAA
jgi:hypothetical protein